ncbi:MAG: adenylate/guanylate cyclase domain-containing protein [Verrucomicrobiota bacterium]|nr:adenylate/guanylate cyclase domain-containing protein [Verrucomicrobiota bacterium]
MKPSAKAVVPALITALSLLFVCSIYWLGIQTRNTPETQFKFDLLDRLEAISYDARVRAALNFNDPSAFATNLGCLLFDDEAVERINGGSLSPFFAPAWDDGNIANLKFKPPWPRFLYGQFIREMNAQGAKAIGFDIFFSEEEEPDPKKTVQIDETNTVTSDEFLALQMAHGGNVYLASEGDVMPTELLMESAAGLANIASRTDYGVLRRVRVFNELKMWHPLLLQQQKIFQLDLDQMRVFPDKLQIPRLPQGGETFEPLEVPLNPNGTLKMTRDGSLNISDDPADAGSDDQQPFMLKRIWTLGIVLAAQHLGIDLDQAQIEKDRIVLKDKEGIERIIPTDEDHYFYVDWSIPFEDLKAERLPIHFGKVSDLLIQDRARFEGVTNDLTHPFKGKLVVVGSVATGNNFTDLGATPLESKTPLVTKHLNIANSLLVNRFIFRMGPVSETMLIIAMGLLASILTWRGRVLTASLTVLFIAVLLVVAAFFLFVSHRYWLPLVGPIIGGLFVPHFALVTYRVMFEQKEQRRVKGVFTKIVSPDVVQELLSAEKLSLGGARRHITVYFADIRGFTEFTDGAQAAAEEYIRKNNLSPKEAEAYFDLKAAETLATVNLYLSTIADKIKKHQGTLDKYIGDCVMAFWGAPVSNPQHALYCVRAAIDAQRSMYELNQQRFVENERRKVENVTRIANGLEPLEMHPLLSLGSGINTGVAIVGLMGSEAHIFNYTVFGREVNLASRLEGVSQRGRIIISEASYKEIQRDDPELAKTIVELPPVTVKGIRQPVKIFEVPWKLSTESAAPKKAVPPPSAAPVAAAKTA